MPRIRIGISSCLLGEKVRYDGRDRRAPFLSEMFGDRAEWVPVCPEVEMGLGVPREPIHLVEGVGGARLIGLTTGTDYTERMREYTARRVEALVPLGLCGYIFKKNSPSCGLTDVEVWNPAALPAGPPERVTHTGACPPERVTHTRACPLERVARRRGLFAEAILARFPYLPVEDEDRLADPRVRADFVERVLACARRLGERG